MPHAAFDPFTVVRVQNLHRDHLYAITHRPIGNGKNFERYEEACEQPQLDTHWWNAFGPFNLLSSMTLEYPQGAHQDVSEEKERSEASWRASMSWARQLGRSCLHFILAQFQWQSALTNSQLIDCRGSPRRCKIRKMPKQKENTKWFNLGCVLFSGRLTHTVATADCVKGNLSWTGGS